MKFYLIFSERLSRERESSAVEGPGEVEVGGKPHPNGYGRIPKWSWPCALIALNVSFIMKSPPGRSSISTSRLRKTVLCLVAVVIISILGFMFISKTKYKQPFFSGSTIVYDSKFEKEGEGKGIIIKVLRG